MNGTTRELAKIALTTVGNKEQVTTTKMQSSPYALEKRGEADGL